MRTVLKRGRFGTVSRVDADLRAGSVPGRHLERDTRTARWWIAPFARRLATREARALAALRRVPGVPRLLAWDGRCLQRSWLEGTPMHVACPRDRTYYREALRLLRRLHSAGIVHRDLATERNWLVTADGQPALVNFQRALRPRYRGRRFRALACADLRHLLEHKRTYCPTCLTARERAFLARRGWPHRKQGRSPIFQAIRNQWLGKR